MMKKRILVFSAVTAVLAAVLLSGCGERADKEPQTEKAQTEAVTEKVTERVQIETQPATETEKHVETEKQTEKQTETEPPTEMQFPDDMTADEEMNYETSLSEAVAYYATDYINVRETPSTENSDNIFYSYEPDDEIIIVGKTPHWYKVDVDGTAGYVFKGVIPENIGGEEAAPAQNNEQPQEPAPEQVQQQEAAPEPEQPQNEAAQAQVPAAAGMIRIASAANIRSDASETASVLGVVNGGDELPLVGENGNWYEVVYNNQTGYVNRNLVE